LLIGSLLYMIDLPYLFIKVADAGTLGHNSSGMVAFRLTAQRNCTVARGSRYKSTTTHCLACSVYTKGHETTINTTPMGGQKECRQRIPTITYILCSMSWLKGSNPSLIFFCFTSGLGCQLMACCQEAYLYQTVSARRSNLIVVYLAQCGVTDMHFKDQSRVIPWFNSHI